MNGLKPCDRIPVVLPNASNERCMAEVEWGYVPDWDHRLQLRGKLYNLRFETLLESLEGILKNKVRESISEAACNRRCIIPVSEAFERSKEDRQVYRLLPNDGEMLYIAGLYSQVQVSQVEELSTVGMLTVDHRRFGRIPLILAPPKSVDQWLDIDMDSKESVISFLRENRYTGESYFYSAKESQRCAEPSHGPSPQTRLSLL
jgi:putative SOS response-associated peptidase YedK